MTIQPIVVGDVIDFSAVFYKDGAVWDVTGAVVTLYLRDPSGVSTGYSGAVTDGPNGKAHHQVDTTVLSLVGDWYRQWVVSLGGVVLKSGVIQFSVLPTLG